MDPISTAYSSLSDLNLWLKVNTDDTLTLADLPAIIRLRYPYIIENWEFIKQRLLRELTQYYDPGRLQEEIASFDDVVVSTRNRGRIDNLIDVSSLLSKYFSVFDNLDLRDLNLSNQEQTITTSESNRVLAFTKKSFLKMRADMEAGRDAVADIMGGSDSDYNAIYDRSPIPERLDRSIKLIGLSAQLQLGIDSCNAILANSVSILSSVAAIDPFAFARANANNPDVNIESYKSGRLTRLNYGESLQTLALRTLGDENRWLEIAIANGLKPPYIDEIGDAVPLIANAKNNTINIAKTTPTGVTNKDRLSVNQIVILQSDTERSPDQRLIVNIREIPVSGELVIELDGSADLDKYKTADSANVRIFRKNTINSNFFILIPSKQEVAPSISNDMPWFLRSKAQDEKQAGVDLLLDDSGDLQFTSSSDVQLSYGAANALQALKILLSTQQGTIRAHPAYGITAQVGQTNANAEAIRRSIAQSVSQQILNDHRFERLEYLTVEYLTDTGSAASGYRVSVGAVLSGGGGNVIPITFTVNASRSSDGG